MQKQSEERTIMVMVFSGKILRNIDGQGEISRRGKEAKQDKGFFNLSAYITAGGKMCFTHDARYHMRSVTIIQIVL